MGVPPPDQGGKWSDMLTEAQDAIADAGTSSIDERRGPVCPRAFVTMLKLAKTWRPTGR